MVVVVMGHVGHSVGGAQVEHGGGVAHVTGGGQVHSSHSLSQAGGSGHVVGLYTCGCEKFIMYMYTAVHSSYIFVASYIRPTQHNNIIRAYMVLY